MDSADKNEAWLLEKHVPLKRYGKKIIISD